jgi:hypothetical protein
LAEKARVLLQSAGSLGSRSKNILNISWNSSAGIRTTTPCVGSNRLTATVVGLLQIAHAARPSIVVEVERPSAGLVRPVPVADAFCEEGFAKTDRLFGHVTRHRIEAVDALGMQNQDSGALYSSSIKAPYQ